MIRKQHMCKFVFQKLYKTIFIFKYPFDFIIIKHHNVSVQDIDLQLYCKLIPFPIILKLNLEFCIAEHFLIIDDYIGGMYISACNQIFLYKF